MPSELHQIFNTEFTLPAGDRRRFDGLTAGFTDEIDSYHVQVNVADDDKHDSDDFSQVFAWERGATNFDPLSDEEYQKADFYACDGGSAEILGIVEDDTARSSA